MYRCKYVYMYICRYVYMYICTCIYVYLFMCTCTYVYMSIYVYTYIYIYIYVITWQGSERFAVALVSAFGAAAQLDRARAVLDWWLRCCARDGAGGDVYAAWIDVRCAAGPAPGLGRCNEPGLCRACGGPVALQRATHTPRTASEPRHDATSHCIR